MIDATELATSLGDDRTLAMMAADRRRWHRIGNRWLVAGGVAMLATIPLVAQYEHGPGWVIGGVLVGVTGLTVGGGAGLGFHFRPSVAGEYVCAYWTLDQARDAVVEHNRVVMAAEPVLDR